ncbi:MAG: glycosyltransferase [Bacteroidetes bacterium]|nr:glycosyltransferase [Bacteroidota bacterium]
MKSSKKVLVAPLDWGLGHAARCIPIIRELQQRGCEVVLASNGRSQYLLENEFPELKVLKLPAYNPHYPVQGSMVWKMLMQLPKFFWTIFREGRSIRKIIKDHSIELIISDNRYGCRNNKVTSVFITHQMNLLIPEKFNGVASLANKIHQSQIKKFNACWIPSPELSMIPRLTNKVDGMDARYIGFLSRFQQKELPKKYKLCVICSGPEPQREIFEKMMENELKESGYASIIIRGKTEAMNPFYRKDNQCTIVNHFKSDEINQVIEESDLIIARSGYTTVMDLMRLGSKAVFIPTPGQTEQEYIAEELFKRGIAYYMKQSEFDLERAIKESEKFTGFVNFEHEDGLLQKALDSVL